MAVEIRELVIKATVVNAGGNTAENGGNTAADRARIIQECVKEVLRIIDKSKSR